MRVESLLFLGKSGENSRTQSSIRKVDMAADEAMKYGGSESESEVEDDDEIAETGVEVEMEGGLSVEVDVGAQKQEATPPGMEEDVKMAEQQPVEADEEEGA
jgi:hypothetical protein